jgi:methionyl-tRNA formyltransferase
VSLVVTQPDRRAGRGRTMRPPPVKVAAQEAGIPVFQPDTLRSDDAVERIALEQPDVLIVVSYGELLRRPVLRMAPRGCLNVHPSLLPRYRGATPIPAAILSGDEYTGVSIIRLIRRLDAGPLVYQHQVPLTGTETSGYLSELLAEESARILPGVVLDWVNGRIEERPQDDELATYTRELRKTDGQIDWNQPAPQIERHVRAMDPWPRAWTIVGEQRLTIHRVAIADRPGDPDVPPGQIAVIGDSVSVATGDGFIDLLEVQPAGKKVMPAADWLRGSRLAGNVRFDLPREPIPPFIETR